MRSSRAAALTMPKHRFFAVSSEGLISANGKIVVYATDGTTVASGINTVKIDRKGIYIIHAAGAIKKVVIP